MDRFRWAVCQLDALKLCLDLKTLRKVLASLPKTLDETYARILCDIPEDYTEHAIRILQWLAYSMRPMRICELAEVIAVQLDGDPWFDHDARFPDPRDILRICPGLVVEELYNEYDYTDEYFNDNECVIIDHGRKNDSEDSEAYSDKEADGNMDQNSSLQDSDQAEDGNQDDEQEVTQYPHQAILEDPSEAAEESEAESSFNSRRLSRNDCIIRLAHFSVKEYLISERIRAQNASSCYAKEASKYAIQEISAHRSIASHCLAYLLQFEYYGELQIWRVNPLIGNIRGYPLSRYAATQWVDHVKRLGKDMGVIETLSLQLLLASDRAYLKWESIDGHYHYYEPVYVPPLYWASVWDAVELVQLLLKHEANINARGGEHHTALQAACIYGNFETVQLLLNNGADVNLHVIRLCKRLVVILKIWRRCNCS